MTNLSKDEILAADDLPTEVVEVPEWGGTVQVRALDGASRDAYNAAIMKWVKGKPEVDPVNMTAKLVALSLVKEGALLFDIHDPADLTKLSRKNGKGLERVAEVARRLSGMSTETAEELEQVFTQAPSEDSSSGSASPWGEPLASSSQS